MKLYSKYPTAISALAFSPDGTKLAIGASYEHDNAVAESDRGMNLIYIKDTVMEDCRVSLVLRLNALSFDNLLVSPTSPIRIIDADEIAQDKSVKQCRRRGSRSGDGSMHLIINVTVVQFKSGDYK